MDARTRLLGEGAGYGRPAEKRAEGASQQKLCLRFVPLPGNRAFNAGRWLALPYPQLKRVDGTLDFTEVTIEYTTHRVTLAGPNLKPLADRIEAGRLPHVVQMDPMQAAYYAAGDDSLHEVTVTVGGRELRAVLAAIHAVRAGLSVEVEDLGRPQMLADGPMTVVTGLAVEELREPEGV